MSIDANLFEPASAIGSTQSTFKGIDWNRFYESLDNLTVPIPEASPGEPIDLAGLREIFTRIQNNRAACDRASRRLLRLVGELKRKAQIAEHDLRVEKSTLADEPLVHSIHLTAAARKARIESIVGPKVSTIGLLKSKIVELEAAIDAVTLTVKTLETAKESANAIKAIALAGMSPLSNSTSFHRR